MDQSIPHPFSFKPTTPNTLQTDHYHYDFLCSKRHSNDNDVMFSSSLLHAGHHIISNARMDPPIEITFQRFGDVASEAERPRQHHDDGQTGLIHTHIQCGCYDAHGILTYDEEDRIHPRSVGGPKPARLKDCWWTNSSKKKRTRKGLETAEEELDPSLDSINQASLSSSSGELDTMSM